MGDVEVLDSPPANGRRAPSLEYKPDPLAAGRVSVRGFRLLLALTLLNTTLLGASVMGPQLFPFLRQQWTQWQQKRAAKKAEEQAKQAALTVRQQCLTYSVPPDTIIYDEDPAEAARLLRDDASTYYSRATAFTNAPRGWIPPVKRASPPFFARFRGAGTQASAASEALLFLHERTTPGGVRHLVAVQSDARLGWHHANRTDQDTGRHRILYRQQKARRLLATAWPVDDANVLSRSTAWRREYKLLLPDAFEREVAELGTGPGSDRVIPQVDYSNVLRVFAGQPDPKDASHFTIAYRIDGRDGVIDGWLKDSGIELRPRDGEWKFDGGEVLRLNAPPDAPPWLYPPEPTSD